MEIASTSTRGPSSATLTGLVDLSRVQAPHQLLQVTGVASSADTDTVYKSAAPEVEQNGSFTIVFLGLPTSSSFNYSVSLSLTGKVYGSVVNEADSYLETGNIVTA